MEESGIAFLKTRIDHTATLHCKDGEVIVGRIHFVSDEDRDVIYDLVSSNRMDRYSSPEGSAYCLTFDEIESVSMP
jgi:hypothetical protein